MTAVVGCATSNEDVAASKFEDAGSLDDDLKRVYELRDLCSQRQDAKVGRQLAFESTNCDTEIVLQTAQNAIDTLLAILQGGSTSRVLLRIVFSTLVAILSNVQAKSLTADSVNNLYRLFIPATKQSLAQDEHLLSSLKIFDLALSKSAQKPDRHDLEAIVTRLAEACFFGARYSQAEGAPRLSTAAPPSRVQAVIPTSGSMGNFAFVARPSTSGRSPGRKASMSSTTSRRSTRSNAVSDSEASECDKTQSSIRDTAAVRIEALRVLAALAKLDTRALHPYWPSFFGPTSKPSLLALAQSDLSLAIRLQATQTTKAVLVNSKGYLDLARESKTPLAFTPLSQTLANIANELNTQLQELLQVCLVLKAKDLLASALQLASAIIASLPYDRLASLRLDSILHFTLENFNIIYDLNCMEPMADLLKAAAQAQKANITLSDSTLSLVDQTLQDVFTQIQSATIRDEDSSQSQLWSILVHLLCLESSAGISESTTKQILRYIEIEFSRTSKVVQEQQIVCLSVLSTTAVTENLHLVLAHLLADADGIASLSVKSKLLALLVTLPETLEKYINIILPLLASLARESSKEIQTQAIRSLGTLLQSSAKTSDVLRKLAFDVLLDSTRTVSSTSIRAEAYWNLANVVEIVPLDKSVLAFFNERSCG